MYKRKYSNTKKKSQAIYIKRNNMERSHNICTFSVILTA